MKNGVILFSVAGSVLLTSSLSNATLTPYAGSMPTGGPDKAPWTAQDFGRTITGFMESVIGLCGEGESKAQLLATQEENNKNATGASGSAASTDTSAGSLTNAIEVDCSSPTASSLKGSTSWGYANPLFSSGLDADPVPESAASGSTTGTGSSGALGADDASSTIGGGLDQTNPQSSAGESGSGTSTPNEQTSTGGNGTTGDAAAAAAAAEQNPYVQQALEQSAAAVQEGSSQTAAAASGTTGTSPNSTQTKVQTFCRSEFPGSSFSYVNTNILAKEGGVGYKPLKTALASASATETLRQNIRKAVLDNFFADATKSEQATTDYQEKIRGQRSAYVQEAAGRHVTLGYRVKGTIQNDLSVIALASLSGDGELGAISVDAHTLEQMVKMELVDLALQIEMMEADAIQFLMHQPVVLMSETKPTSSN